METETSSSPITVHRMVSTHGRDLLIHDGYKFRMFRATRHEQFWRCCYKSCCARMRIAADVVVHSRLAHCHARPRHLQRDVIRNRLKQRARDGVNPAVLKEELESISRSADICPLDLRAIRAAITRKPPPTEVDVGRVEERAGGDPLDVDSESSLPVELQTPKQRKSGSIKKVDGKEAAKTAMIDEGPSTSMIASQFSQPDFSHRASSSNYEALDASTSMDNAHFMTLDPLSSSDPTQFTHPEIPPLVEPGLFESHMYVSSNPITFEDEVPTSNAEADEMSSDSSKESFQTPTESMSVKVKPIDTLQAGGALSSSDPTNVEDGDSNDDINVKALKSAIQRLESVSDKLAAASLLDGYDQFGKYISSLLRGLPIRKVNSLKQKIIADVLKVVNQEEEIKQSESTKQCKCWAEQTQLNRPTACGNVNTNSGATPTIPVKRPTVVGNIPYHAKSMNGPAVDGNIPFPEPLSSLRKQTYTPSSASNTTILKDDLTLTRPRKKRKGEVATYSNKKKHVSETAKQARPPPPPYPGTSFGDGSIRNEQPSEPHDINSQDNFDIDIEEGNVLDDIKPDHQQFFETVLCDTQNHVYIKEEPPEPDHTPAADTLAPARPRTTTTLDPNVCGLCSERCSSREDFVAHIRSAHPGIAW